MGPPARLESRRALAFAVPSESRRSVAAVVVALRASSLAFKIVRERRGGPRGGLCLCHTVSLLLFAISFSSPLAKSLTEFAQDPLKVKSRNSPPHLGSPQRSDLFHLFHFPSCKGNVYKPRAECIHEWVEMFTTQWARNVFFSLPFLCFSFLIRLISGEPAWI